MRGNAQKPGGMFRLRWELRGQKVFPQKAGRFLRQALRSEISNRGGQRKLRESFSLIVISSLSTAYMSAKQKQMAN